MANVYDKATLTPKRYRIEKLENKTIIDAGPDFTYQLRTLWPETIADQVIQQTNLRFINQNSLVLGSTLTNGVLNTGTSELGWTATLQKGSQTANIVLTLPSSGGTLALTTDLPPITVTDGIWDLAYDTGTGAISVSPYATAADGKFNNSSTLATGTTALGYSGSFYANKLYSGGTEVVTSASGSPTSLGLAIISASNIDGVLTLTSDEFVHVGTATAGENIAQTIYGTKTFNSEIVGSVSGYSKQIYTGSSSTNASFFLTFVDSNNGTAVAETLYTDAGITYNPSTDALSLTGDLAVNGGDLTTTATTFNLINATATTINAFNAATSATIGYTGTAASTTDISTGINASGQTKIINIGSSGASGSTTTINIGADGVNRTSNVNIYGNLNVSGKVNTISTEEILISDNVITLNSDLNDTPVSGWTAGIKVRLADVGGNPAYKSLFWDHDDSRWEIDGNPLAILSNIKDATITIAGGTDLEIDTAGGANGAFTTNQADNETITLNHSAVTRTDTTSTSSPANGGTFTAVDTITTSSTGHITAVNLKTVTLPNADTYTINATAITGGGAQLNLDAASGTDSLVEFLGSGGTTVTRTDSDTITISSSNKTITLAAGNGLVTGGSFTLDNSADKTITLDLGTPSTLSSTSTNAASADSHTHAISSGDITGETNVLTVTGTGKALDSGIALALATAYGDTKNPYGNKSPNFILSGPASGSTAATPSFRAMVNADLPESGVSAFFANPTTDQSKTFSTVTVNRKGVVTAGAQLIEVGGQYPSDELVVNGLFFEEVAV
jgi:hypothetical protein